MADLDARYGRRPGRTPRRRTALVVGGLAVAVSAVVGFYVWSSVTQDPFSSTVLGFSVDSDTLVTVDVALTDSGDDPVRCELVAKDRYTQPVGTAVVEGAPGTHAVAVRAAITTTARAVTVVVRDCVAVPARVP